MKKIEKISIQDLATYIDGDLYYPMVCPKCEVRCVFQWDEDKCRPKIPRTCPYITIEDKRLV